MRFSTRLKPSNSLVDMTPLVDLIFLLLIFFIVPSDVLPLKSLYLEQPTIDIPSEPLTTRLMVVVDGEVGDADMAGAQGGRRRQHRDRRQELQAFSQERPGRGRQAGRRQHTPQTRRQRRIAPRDDAHRQRRRHGKQRRANQP